MKKESIPFGETGKFSQLLSDYLNQEPALAPFYEAFPTLENLNSLAQDYSLSRNTLTQVLRSQHANIEVSEPTAANISSLENENTFTVCTGHQLCLGTGPLFFLYKIASAIKLAEQLNAHSPEKHFVPVFWMASEDHDFDEINHFHLFGKSISFDHPQGNEEAVGRLILEDPSPWMAQLPEEISALQQAYREGESLSMATRRLVNSLFGSYGLVILDADDAELKSLVAPHFRRELLEQVSTEQVSQKNDALEKAGYTPQAHAREINLFYLNNGHRGRIERQNQGFTVVGTDLQFSQEEVLNLLETYPERFSPNVILRPVYQQVILPNIAYIGGPAEVAYWFQLKGVFDALEVQYPAVLPRSCNMLLPKSIQKKMDKLSIQGHDLFHEEKTLKERVLSELGVEKIDLKESITSLERLFEEVALKASSIDPTLSPAAKAEGQRAQNQLEKFEKRLQKTQEQQHDQRLKQLHHILDKLFPNGGLQERHENLFQYFTNDPAFIQKIVELTDPLDFRFNLLYDE